MTSEVVEGDDQVIKPVPAHSVDNSRQMLSLRTKVIEILSLLMVLDSAKFDLYLEMLMKSIDDERPEPKKSLQVI